MKLVINAKALCIRAYSMWANYLGIAVLVAPEAIYIITGIDTNPRVWWIAGLVLILGGIVGRLIDQGTARSSGAVLVAAIILAMAQMPVAAPGNDLPRPFYTRADVLDAAVPLIRKWEGEHRCADNPKMHCAYLDRIAEPDVWTGCHGETKGIGPGMRWTDANAPLCSRRGLVISLMGGAVT